MGRCESCIGFHADMFGLKTKVVKCNDQTAAEEANSLLHSKACEN